MSMMVDTNDVDCWKHQRFPKHLDPGEGGGVDPGGGTTRDEDLNVFRILTKVRSVANYHIGFSHWWRTYSNSSLSNNFLSISSPTWICLVCFGLVKGAARRGNHCVGFDRWAKSQDDTMGRGCNWGLKKIWFSTLVQSVLQLFLPVVGLFVLPNQFISMHH